MNDTTTNTPDQAAKADRATAWDDRERDRDEPSDVEHAPCTRQGCLVCDLLPKAWAEHVAQQNSEWWESA